MITAENLRFKYNSYEVLKGISLHIQSGEISFILGPNGSGKSTLLKCLAYILKPKGTVYIDKEEISRLPRREVAKRIGYLPQRETANELTVFETVLLGRKPHMSWGPSKRDIETVKRIIQMLGLEALSLRRLTQLSGGELQKVLIARALAQEPKIILLDEPTSSLDLKNQVEVMNLLKTVVKKMNISAVVTTHDLNIAAVYADMVSMLSRGQIVALGGVEILNSENIKRVYGINPKIIHHYGRPIIIPEHYICARGRHIERFHHLHT